MTRRGDSLSFLRRRRRRDFYERRRAFPSSNGVLAIAMVASIGLAVFAFLRGDGTGEVNRSLPPVIYEPVTTSTTLAIEAGTSFLECPGDTSEGWTTFQGSMTRSGCTTASRRITEPEVLWQSEVAVFGWLNNPVIANGRLYLRDQDLIFCFNIRE